MKSFEQAHDDAWRDFLLFLRQHKTALYTALFLTLPLMLLTHVFAPLFILPVTFIVPICLALIFSGQFLGHFFSNSSASKPKNNSEYSEENRAEPDAGYTYESSKPANAPDSFENNPEVHSLLRPDHATLNPKKNKSSPQLFRPVSPESDTDEEATFDPIKSATRPRST